MIRIQKRISSNPPEILLIQGKYESDILAARYDRGEREFISTDFKGAIYAHDSVKKLLIEIQNYKCCFCESKIGHISYGDVEHYRPKAGWVQADENLNKPGYYWLAYEWNNLLLSCQLCNQRYKKNLFPLINNTSRVLSHHSDINLETPCFLNPNFEDVQDLIEFKEEIPISRNADARAEQTIKNLGLDRELLNEQRRAILNMIRDIYDLALGYPETYPELKQAAINKVLKYHSESLTDETEYALMKRNFFKTHPIAF